MIYLLTALVILAQAEAPLPPCAGGGDDCKPWERQWSSQAEPNPFAKYVAQPETFGPNPHTLIISDGDALKTVDYASGPVCQRARDLVRQQTSANSSGAPGIVISSRIVAFCVPK